MPVPSRRSSSRARFWIVTGSPGRPSEDGNAARSRGAAARAAPRRPRGRRRDGNDGRRTKDGERKDPHPAEGLRPPDPRCSRRPRSSTRLDGPARGSSGPIPLPTHMRQPLDMVLPLAPTSTRSRASSSRSRTHKRLLDIFEPTSQTVDALMKLELPAGVDVEIKAFGPPPALR